MYFERAGNNELIKVGSTVKVQQITYQQTINLSPQFLAEWQDQIPRLKSAAVVYNLPYRLGAKQERVLVVGAGMGNDVAAALRNGAGSVDAVDIDPAILALGRQLHPEAPYSNPRVKLIVNDARSFFKTNSGRYDMVVFGLLDSYTLLSSLSSVTLDSFVYTLESLRQAQQHLTDDGVLVMAFYTGNVWWIEQRIGRLLEEVFGAGQVFSHSEPVGTTFVVGPVSPERLAEAQLTVWQPNPAFDNMPLPTDDWPFLYLQARAIPAAYWQAVLLIGLVCLALIARSFPQALRPNWHFWLLGAAFLLVEFKSITELALLFGSTWLVNILAISGVLLMALGANLLVLWRQRFNLRGVYVFLFASLVLAYVFPLNALNVFAPALRAVISMILVSLPLFFAGLIFSESLRRTGETAGPLASNLSGSVVGGILEYGAIWWGIKSLYVIAAIVYAGALAASRLQKN